MPSNLLHRAALLLAAGVLVSPVACVTEKSGPARGVAVPVAGPRPDAGKGQRTLELPDGPIAKPADPGATLNTHVQVAIKPLGGLDYDGLTLPVASPDGRFIAAQSGDAPTWSTLLAEPGQAAPASSFITGYELVAQSGELRKLEWSQPPPAGLLLGRAADDRGVLVESPRPDGARWIGKLDWVTGSVQWLVQGDAVNAQAFLTARGELLYTRRSADGRSADLVLRDAQGRESVRPASDTSAKAPSQPPDTARYWFPAATSDDAYVYAVHQPAADGPLELQAIRVNRSGERVSPGSAPPPRLGSVVARRRVADAGDGVLAYQMMSATLSAPPSRGDDAGPALIGSRLLFFHPALQRACVFDVDGAAWRALAPQSIAAAPAVGNETGGEGSGGGKRAVASERGYFCATPQGIVYALPNSDKSVRVITGSYVPRAYAASPPSLTLIGQVPGRPDRLNVFRLYVGHDTAGDGR